MLDSGQHPFHNFDSLVGRKQFGGSPVIQQR